MSTKLKDGSGVPCADDDPARYFFNDDGAFDGFEYRCQQHPEQEHFIADGGLDPEINDPGMDDFEHFYFLVGKDGVNSNTTADGTRGVPKWAHDNLDMGDTTDVTCGICGEVPDIWDVRNNKIAREGS